MLGTDPNYVVDYTSQSRRTFGEHDVRSAKPERVRRDANFSNAGLFEGTNGVLQNPRPDATVKAATLQAACRESVAQRQVMIQKGKDRSSQIEFQGTDRNSNMPWSSETGAQMRDGCVAKSTQPAQLKSVFEPPRNPIHHGASHVPATSFEHPQGQAKRVSLDRRTQQQFLQQSRSGFATNTLQGILS